MTPSLLELQMKYRWKECSIVGVNFKNRCIQTKFKTKHNSLYGNGI